MRHRNEEEDDFGVRSTGRQRVVFVAIILVRSNALAVSFCHFSFLFPFVRRHSKPYYGSKP